MLCDFCSDPLPVRELPAETFILDEARAELPPMQSTGGWTACAECGAMIDARNWNALEERAMGRMAKKYQGLLPHNEIRKIVRRSHGGFREHMLPKQRAGE
jgi:hypothetical protein